MGIIYGVADLGDSNGLFLKAEKLISHENFSYGQLHNDIAVMKLEKEIPYSTKAQPTVLPTSAAINTPAGTFTGWGRKSVRISSPFTLDNIHWMITCRVQSFYYNLIQQFKGQGERYLQQIELKLLPNEQCKKIMPFVTPLQICTLNKVGEGVCIVSTIFALMLTIFITQLSFFFFKK